MDESTQPATALAGQPLTAVGVAVIRAKESRRPDRLYSDPYASAFVDAAERAHLSPAAPDGAAQTWASLLELAEAMYETRTLGVRIVDDALVEAASAGRTQIVLIGAGLDTHAFRLTWPRPVRLFEIDLPPLFAFKEPILRSVGATANCERHVIAADLGRGDWRDMLMASGFQPDVPTHWVDHALMTLPTATARAGVTTISNLSAPGSQYGFPVLERQRYTKTLRSVRGAEGLYRGIPNSDRGLGEDAREWIESLGWTTTFRTLAELTAGYARSVGADTDSGNVIATRC